MNFKSTYPLLVVDSGSDVVSDLVNVGGEVLDESVDDVLVDSVLGGGLVVGGLVGVAGLGLDGEGTSGDLEESGVGGDLDLSGLTGGLSLLDSLEELALVVVEVVLLSEEILVELLPVSNGLIFGSLVGVLGVSEGLSEDTEERDDVLQLLGVDVLVGELSKSLDDGGVEVHELSSLGLVLDHGLLDLVDLLADLDESTLRSEGLEERDGLINGSDELIVLVVLGDEDVVVVVSVVLSGLDLVGVVIDVVVGGGKTLLRLRDGSLGVLVSLGGVLKVLLDSDDVTLERGDGRTANGSLVLPPGVEGLLLGEEVVSDLDEESVDLLDGSVGGHMELSVAHQSLSEGVLIKLSKRVESASLEGLLLSDGNSQNDCKDKDSLGSHYLL